jgi:ArsR family transcriptional regulator
MTVIKALADENRVRILMALRGRELCVCEIIGFLGLAPSTVSKHMSILKNARLVESRKDGRWVFYRLAEEDTLQAVQNAQSWVINCLENDPEIIRDEKTLARQGITPCN